MRSKLSLTAAMVLFSLVCSAQSGDETYIGIVRLKTGTPQRFVIAELSKEYKVEDTSAVSANGTRWFNVEGKEGNDRGSVFFKDGKLSGVMTTLFSQAVKSEFAENLYTMTKSFINDAGNQCAIDTVSSDNDGIRARGVWYTCSGRKLKVMMVWDRAGNETATITEEIGTAQ